MLRNSRGRSARGEPVETDPRFMRPADRLGVARAGNWGTTVELLGSNPQHTVKLVRIDGDSSSPYVVSVNALYTGAVGLTPSNGVSVRGIFGAGSTTNVVDFDAKPDVTVQLPGGTIDLDVSWATTLTLPGGAVVQESVIATMLPARASIQAVACRGEQSRGRATKTQFVQVTGAAVAIIPIPRFADDFMWYGDVVGGTGYANLVSLSFMSGTDITNAQVIADYTQAQILAIRNAGGTIPVPGIASGLKINSGLASGWATYFLSL